MVMTSSLISFHIELRLLNALRYSCQNHHYIIFYLYICTSHHIVLCQYHNFFRNINSVNVTLLSLI